MSAIGKAEAMTGTSRREFLKVSLAAGGGLLFAFPVGRAMAQAPAKYVLRPEAFVRIDPNGHVTLIIPQEEMGQGVYTSLAQLLADELDVGFDRVTAEAAGPSDTIYGSPMGVELQEYGAGALDQVFEDMSDSARQYESPDGFAAPMAAHIVTATR